MRSIFSILLLTFAAVCFSRVAVAACADLPPSTLRLYAIKAPALDVWRVPEETLPHDVSANEFGSRHSLMLTLSEVITFTEIRHRIVPQADGSVCDAPSLVRIGFGSHRRMAYIAREAAADACVRQKLLVHEEDHARRFAETVDRFIAQQAGNLQRGMKALKQMPAPKVEVAQARWEAGLRMIVAEAKRQLVSDIRAANAALDDGPTLAALANACGGKLRQLQASQGF
jgi:hypothetical protein